MGYRTGPSSALSISQNTGRVRRYIAKAKNDAIAYEISVAQAAPLPP
jgi:hypothetical protein